MSNKQMQTPRARAREVIIVTGKFKPNGAGAIDNTANVPAGPSATQGAGGWTVARTGVGLYVLTLDDNYVDLFDVQFQLWGAATAGYSFVVTAQAVSSTTAPTITVQYMLNAAGTYSAADIASGASNFISFTAKLRNTAGNA